MPEEGQELPRDPKNMQERDTSRETFAMRARRAAKRVLDPKSKETRPQDVPVVPVETIEPENREESAPKLFREDSELEGLPLEVIRALRQAQRMMDKDGGLARDGLASAFMHINGQVLDGAVEGSQVDGYLAEINARVKELDDQKESSKNTQPLDVSPISEVIREGQERFQEVIERLGSTLEDGHGRVQEAVSRGQKASDERVNQFMEQMSEKLGEMVSGLGRRASPEGLEETQTTQTQALMEMMGGEPSKMRERWAQAEYRQDFWMRFNPGQEPRFYTSMDYEGRAALDARWRLARAATAARALSGRAEDYVTKNQELGLITEEEMRRLYEMQGVRPALEWYADLICNNKTVEVRRGEKKIPITIWECRNDSEFQQIRRTMRNEALVDLTGGDDITDFGGGVKEELDKYEADAVAWNLITITNLLESMDSRYSKSGARHDTISGELLSDDVRALLHPQEKWESKMASKVGWGIMSGWGITQVDRIKTVADATGRDDDVKFVAARKMGEYWGYSVVDKPDKGKLVTIKAPECFPTTTGGSYLERWKAGDDTLLNKLLKKEQIDWNEVDSGTWNRYLFVNLYQALKLLKYWNPGVPFEMGKPGYAASWPGDLQEAISRTGMEGKLSKGEKHNLKVWAVIGNIGVTEINKRIPSPHILGMTLSNLEVAFRMPHIGYLENGGLLGYRGEKLKLEDLD